MNPSHVLLGLFLPAECLQKQLWSSFKIKKKSLFTKLKNDQSDFSVIAPKLESVISAYQ